MKKLLTISFLTLGIILISGCSLNEQKLVNNSAMTKQITTLQQQMNSLSSQMETLNNENEQLRKESDELKKENNELKQNNIVKEEIASSEEAVANYVTVESKNDKEGKNIQNDEISYCNKEPGQQVTNPKYKNLGSLGLLFTASDCGGSALQRFTDIQAYRIDIWLNKQPSQSLIETYISIGFNCYEVDSGKNCKSEIWQKRLSLKQKITTSALLKLKPYYEYFEKVEDFSEIIE